LSRVEHVYLLIYFAIIVSEMIYYMSFLMLNLTHSVYFVI